MEILLCLAVGFFGAMLLSRLLHSADDGSRAKNLAVKIFGGGGPGPVRQE